MEWWACPPVFIELCSLCTEMATNLLNLGISCLWKTSALEKASPHDTKYWTDTPMVWWYSYILNIDISTRISDAGDGKFVLSTPTFEKIMPIRCSLYSTVQCLYIYDLKYTEYKYNFKHLQWLHMDYIWLWERKVKLLFTLQSMKITASFRCLMIIFPEGSSTQMAWHETSIPTPPMDD